MAHQGTDAHIAARRTLAQEFQARLEALHTQLQAKEQEWAEAAKQAQEARAQLGARDARLEELQDKETELAAMVEEAEAGLLGDVQASGQVWRRSAGGVPEFSGVPACCCAPHGG